MKSIIIIVVLILGMPKADAQKTYRITAYGGWQHTLAQRGPKGETEISPVKFVKPISRMFGLNFDMQLNEKWTLGIDILYGELDWGYEVLSNRNLPQSVGLYSGMLGNGGFTKLYTGGLKIGYDVFEIRKWRGRVFITPNIGFYPFDKMLADTVNGNSFDRGSDTIYSNPTLYINYPPYQNQGFYFLMRLGYEQELKLGRHISLTGRVCYQQGFQTFVIGYTNIQRLRDPSGPLQQMYYTKVNGTALQWHLGLRYNFK